MSQVTRLPCINHVDFYRLHEDALIGALAQATVNYFDQSEGEDPTDNQKAIIAFSRMSYDVPNGGFTQFFYNHRGDDGVEQSAVLLESLDLPKASVVLRDAAAVFRSHQAEFRVANPWDGLFGSIKEFEKLEKKFMAILLRCNRSLETWIRSNIAILATNEGGEQIDPDFTGAVETKQPNGLVSQYLEVKKGKPSGAYREFFDDGTVRKVVFYKAGKVSGDFWPDGQLKRKESKRGNLTIIEWFYPSGQLQKRYVEDKNGFVVEPIRLYHENGQLAEELTKVKDKKCGPWLKFFGDGSPQLEAEYLPGEKLIVRNAWDQDRNQVVKDGTGRFRDGNLSIDWRYDLFIDLNWPRETELKDGFPHGKTTRYNHDVLWGVSSFVNGIEEGESTTYWNNGRVRSVTKFVHGKAGKEKTFPKFDRPVPIVLLTVEASEKLYKAWDHIKVDEYPRVLNLDEIQNQLEVPDFLREVHERNLAQALKSEYEDCSTFNDGIGYFLIVNESGEVTSASPTASGVYSGGSWKAYPPFLLKLRFTPGRIRGRAIECRVYVGVDHTFVES